MKNMQRRFLVLFCLALCGSVAFADAQHQELNVEQIGPSGQAYLDSLRFSRVEPVVSYFDPTRPPPPLETREPVRAFDDEGLEWRTSSTIGKAIPIAALLVLFAILFVFLKYGGAISMSFAREQENDAETGGHETKSVEEAPISSKGLQEVLNMPDRRYALIELCKILLQRVVASEGVNVQSSWTDRDKLRRVPDNHAQREDLASLVYDSEGAQFGGRDVSETDFQAYLVRLKPLIWDAQV